KTWSRGQCRQVYPRRPPCPTPSPTSATRRKPICRGAGFPLQRDVLHCSPGAGWAEEACLASFVGRADHDQAAIGTWNGTADQHHVVVVVDTDDMQVADRRARGAIPAGHAFALLGPAATAV